MPTKIGINGMLVSMKRNNLIKAFVNFTAENENYNKEDLEKKFDTAYQNYLEATRQICNDSIYKKVKNNSASEFEKNALSNIMMY